MNFEVSTLTGRSLTIETHQDATVSDLQNEIAKEGLPVPCQQLMVKERMLLSEEKLENIAMKHGHTLYLLSNVRAGMEVEITSMEGHKFKILIDDTTTVSQLKMLIQEKRAIDANMQRLVISIRRVETEMFDRKEVVSYFPDNTIRNHEEYSIALLLKGSMRGTRNSREVNLEPIEIEQSDRMNSKAEKKCCCSIL